MIDAKILVYRSEFGHIPHFTHVCKTKPTVHIVSFNALESNHKHHTFDPGCFKVSNVYCMLKVYIDPLT